MFRIPEGTVLYHLTDDRNVERILVEGLVPGASKPKGVYLWYRLEWARRATFPGEVLLSVDASGLEVHGDPLGDLHACYHEHPIEPQRVRLYDKEGART